MSVLHVSESKSSQSFDLAKRSCLTSESHVFKELDALFDSILDDGSMLKFEDVVKIVNKIIFCVSSGKDCIIKQVLKMHEFENYFKRKSEMRHKLLHIANQERLKQDQLETRLDDIEKQQRKLEAFIDSFQQSLMKNNNINNGSFIHDFYDQTETVNAKLQQMKDDLFSVSENINLTSDKRGQNKDNSNEPIQRTTEILDTFQRILDFFEKTITKLENRVYNRNQEH